MQTTSGTANTIDTAEGQNNLITPTLINAGTLLINDNSSLTLASPYAIDNSGTIQLSSTGDATYLYFDQADAGINGGGHIILSASAANIIAVTQSGDQLTNFDNTITGAGAIGTGGMVLVNDGVINADQQSAALTLDPAFLENTGTVEATTDATLVLSNTTVSNSSATAEAGGSSITQSTIRLLSASRLQAALMMPAKSSVLISPVESRMASSTMAATTSLLTTLRRLAARPPTPSTTAVKSSVHTRPAGRNRVFCSATALTSH